MKKLFRTRYTIVALLFALSYVCAFAEKKHVPTDLQGRELPSDVILPKYGNGMSDLKNYLKEHVKYPKDHAIAGEGGRVVLRFTIDEGGHVHHPVVVKSASPLMDAEALRVVSEMDDWNPGFDSEGNPLSIRFFMPVTFRFRHQSTDFLEPHMKYMDITSSLGKKLSLSYLTSKIGEPYETDKKKLKGERVRSYYYYDRGDDILKTSKKRGFYSCQVESPRFTFLGGYIKVGIDCPKDLEDNGWILVKTKPHKIKKYVIKTYNIPELNTRVALRINKEKGVIYSYKVTVMNQIEKRS